MPQPGPKHPTIYLDNAATTWPKPEEVYRAVDVVMREHGANPGRGAYRMSVDAQRIVDDTRQAIARLFNAPAAERVIFTLNTTDALCIALKGLIDPAHRVVTGPYEHNSVARPLESLRRAGAHVAVANPTPDFGIDLDHVRALCREGVDFVVVSHVSNVTGAIAPIEDIAAIAHAHGALLIVDAAQSAGSIDIDMQAMGIDLLAAPGHKGLLGPMGTGVLVLAAPLPVRPLREGGTGFKSESLTQPEEYPWRLEAGTLNLPGIAGLAAGVQFVRSKGARAIGTQEAQLARSTAEALRDLGVRLYCGRHGPETGVFSFRVEDVDPAITGAVLDGSFGVAVRTGLHCAPSAHRVLGTLPQGTVRASFGIFNTLDHARALVSALTMLAGKSR